LKASPLARENAIPFPPACKKELKIPFLPSLSHFYSIYGKFSDTIFEA
jgi:hypothetical protein